jgi:formylglycine-generating enzyme required for sulfatase activity/predicted Ser/Thr protein kinase
MTGKREEKIEELFHAALERPPAERNSFLDEACADDGELRAEVGSLLGARERASDFPDKPAWAPLVNPGEKEGRESAHPEPESGLPFERLGEFRLLARIGEGGMGVVYRAVQESLDRQVCVKVIRSDRIGSFEAEARFGREIEAVSSLRHPGIVSVYGSGEELGVRWFAMELVPGAGLDELLRDARRKEKHPTVEQIATWIRDAARALDCAHGAGIVHRDVKPSNIRVTPDGRAMLLDFGVARHVNLSTLTLTGEFRGTPHYASPEQIKGSRAGIDARTDIYSLGVTLYEAAAGRLPFEGETTEQIFHQILDREPVPPRRLNPAIPRDLETVIMKAVEKEPERRYRRMANFADDLQRILDGKTILAKPAGFATRTWKRIRRNPVVSGAVAVALIALTALAVAVPFFVEEKGRGKALADSRILARLVEEEKEIRPAWPDRAAALEEWLTEAAALKKSCDEHRKDLAALRKRGKPVAGAEKKEDAWIFDDHADQSRHNTLSALVTGIDSLTADGAMTRVEKRFAFACTIYERSIESRRADWDRAITSIADRSECPLYGGLVIEPCLGLVPIGRNPESGLWEFVHLQTGEEPQRGPDGKPRLDAETGLIFVLLPGGLFDMGAEKDGPGRPKGSPNTDPLARPFEMPVHPVRLKPFFLSRHEMTQGQWLRFTGGNPSHYQPACRFGDKQHSLLHPLENVSWVEARRALARLGLRLPTEAEWEYAVRAGTTTVWWTGNEKESLAGAVNLMDVSCDQSGGAADAPCEKWLDDGYVVHAPVNAFRPNHFGLYGMGGNAYEWCEDAWYSNYEGAPDDGSARTAPSPATRVCRDACWDGPASSCRAAYRIWRGEEYRDCGLGVRPALSLPAKAPGRQSR